LKKTLLQKPSFPLVSESVKPFWELLQRGYIGEGFTDTGEFWLYSPVTMRRVSIDAHDFKVLSEQSSVRRQVFGVCVTLYSYKGDTRRTRRAKRRAKHGT
jgi:hypothetical protein